MQCHFLLSHSSARLPYISSRTTVKLNVLLGWAIYQIVKRKNQVWTGASVRLQVATKLMVIGLCYSKLWFLLLMLNYLAHEVQKNMFQSCFCLVAFCGKKKLNNENRKIGPKLEKSSPHPYNFRTVPKEIFLLFALCK